MRKEDKRRFFTALFAPVMALSAFAAPKLAFQVYAVKELCEKDFPGSLDDLESSIKYLKGIMK